MNMNEVSFSISIPTDSEGFITLQCPFCNDKFKLKASDFEREDIFELFCPYCGLKDEASSYIKDEVKEQAQVLAVNYAKSHIHKLFQNFEKTSRGNKSVSFKAGKIPKMEDEKVLFESEGFERIDLKCCDISVKTNFLNQEFGVYCPCCGVK